MKKLGWLVMMLGVVFSGSSVHFQIWKDLCFQMKNSYKIWENSEKNRDGGNYCWMLLSGSSVDVQKRKFVGF